MINIKTNWHKLHINASKININFLENIEKEEVKQLRKQFPSTKFMYYDGVTYFWGNPIDLAYKAKSIEVNDSPYLFIKILSNSIVEQFFNNPDVYIERRMNLFNITDYRQELLKDEYSYLNLYRNYHLHFTPLYYKGTHNLGVSITTSIADRLNWKRLDFIDNDIEFEDLSFNEKDGIVKTNSKSKFRIGNFYGDSSKLKADLDFLSNSKFELNDIVGCTNEFIDQKKSSFSLPDDLRIIKIEKPKIGVSSSDEIQLSQLATPMNYFYNGNTPPKDKISYAMRSKIKYNKPFSFDQFENRDINIGVIYPRIYHKNIAKFFKVVQSELVTIYRIPKNKFKYTKIEIDDFQLESYQKKMQNIRQLDLIVVLVDESHESLLPKDSPYHFCKAEFLKRGINSQEVQLQQVNKFLIDHNSGQANYADHTISLNIYAKLGGTAWTIKPNGTIMNELVFGVGATVDDDGQPILGMTSIFRGDGKYLFGDIVSVVNMDDYQKKLEDLIFGTIQEYINAGILNSNNKIRLIFHLFKKAGKENEILALKKAVEKFKDLDIEHMFIHVGDGHNYRFYSVDNSSDNHRVLDAQKRGRCLVINDKLAFISLRKNSSTYTKIEIDKRSNYINIPYAVNQVFNFSEISHTSFNKQGQPVTIKYPKLMARISDKLKKLQGFYLKNISMPDDSLWFI